jgi:hypothetical protein
MMTRTFGLVLFTTLVQQAFAGDKAWTYLDWTTPKAQIVLRPHASVLGDLTAKAEFCSTAGDFDCFNIGEMKFAIPRGFSADSSLRAWTYAGRRYEVASAETSLEVFGKRIEATIVESRSQEQPMRFFFSPEVGLLAFHRMGDGAKPLFILAEKCGFGAPPTCYR